MNEININNWKQFKVGELFDIKKPRVLHKREVELCDEGVNYVVRTKFNNGVNCKVRLIEGIKPTKRGVISFGSENSSFFYQDEEFYSGRDIYYIDTANISKSKCLFLISCLSKVTDKYSYNYGLFPDLLKNEKIKLPVKNDQPDWDFMEDYIDFVEIKQLDKIINLESFEVEKTLINTDNWKEYNLTDLFEIAGSRTTAKNEIDFKDDGKYPYITTAGTNNGVSGYSDLFTEEGNVLTVDSAVLGSVFYQKDNFTASDHVEKLIPRFSMNEYSGNFVATVLNISAKSLGYLYNNKRSQTALKKETIKLPTTLSDEPDWDYMEKFMKEIEVKSYNKIKNLECVI